MDLGAGSCLTCPEIRPGYPLLAITRGTPEATPSARGAAVGVPEARNMSGMMSVLSVPIVMATRGAKTDP